MLSSYCRIATFLNCDNSLGVTGGNCAQRHTEASKANVTQCPGVAFKTLPQKVRRKVAIDKIGKILLLVKAGWTQVHGGSFSCFLLA
jgi:hypothetical protein